MEETMEKEKGIPTGGCWVDCEAVRGRRINGESPLSIVIDYLIYKT